MTIGDFCSLVGFVGQLNAMAARIGPNCEKDYQYQPPRVSVRVSPVTRRLTAHG